MLRTTYQRGSESHGARRSGLSRHSSAIASASSRRVRRCWLSPRTCVSQSTAGSWMGTTTNGTDTGAETNGMNHFVGVPVYGWNFYGWVSVPYTPSSSDATTFWTDLKFDISASYGSTLVGDAYEVVNGPHLAGHPNQNIFHYFEIGGWDQGYSEVYYADSATTVWSSVPAYSWFDQWTMVVILGGRGYIW